MVRGALQGDARMGGVGEPGSQCRAIRDEEGRVEQAGRLARLRRGALGLRQCEQRTPRDAERLAGGTAVDRRQAEDRLIPGRDHGEIADAKMGVIDMGGHIERRLSRGGA